MDPHYFPEPRRFDPERFLDDNGKLKHVEQFLPFGIGKFRGGMSSAFQAASVSSLTTDQQLTRYDVCTFVCDYVDMEDYLLRYGFLRL